MAEIGLASERVDVGVVAVDVANVCRDNALPGRVGLDRLDLVVEAWRSQISHFAELHLVADRSLLSDLSKPDRRRLGELRRRRELLVSRRHADERVLELAEATGGCVLSRDRFLDKRRGRSWAPERFFCWTVDQGKVTITRRRQRNTQPYEISRKEEQKLAEALGIPDLRHPAARRRWACVSKVTCPTREATPDALQVLPLLKRERALCPGCGHPLEDRGPRQTEAEMKIVVDELVAGRFAIKQGETIAFGRLAMPDTRALAELAWTGAFADLGRVHAELRLNGKRLAVRPVDEDHPVWVRGWISKNRRFGREQKLRQRDGFTSVDLRDALVIGERVELQRSGRCIAEAEAARASAEPQPWQQWYTEK
jgi:hypothetical protein